LRKTISLPILTFFSRWRRNAENKRTISPVLARLVSCPQFSLYDNTLMGRVSLTLSGRLAELRQQASDQFLLVKDVLAIRWRACPVLFDESIFLRELEQAHQELAFLRGKLQ
jgi:hypothetical protein